MKRSPLAKVSKKRGRNRSLRKKLWPECSKRIRALDGKCMLAGYFGSKCGGVLQASHILPKGKYPLLELYPLNCVAACYVCHLFGWHKSPLDAARWYKDLPLEWRERLEIERAHSLDRKGMTEEQIRAEWKECGI